MIADIHQAIARVCKSAPPDPVPSPREVYYGALDRLRDDPTVRLGREGDLDAVDISIDAVLDNERKQQGVADVSKLENISPVAAAHIDALEARRTELLGERPVAPKKYALSLSEAIRGYLETARARKTAQTAGQAEAVLRLFLGYIGDRPVNQLTKRDVRGFIEEVERFDPHWGRRPGAKNLTWDQLVARFQGPVGVQRLAARTINRYVSDIKGMWSWVHRHEDDADVRDIVQGLWRQGKDSSYVEFDPDELQALFSEPAPKNPLFWELPLVSLYTGLRLNEICSLEWENVRDYEDVVYFDITEAKSEAGKRRVPVPDQLSWLLERRQSSGSLWPTLKPYGPDKKLSGYFSKEFPKFRRRRGAARETTVFHSFRKNAIGRLYAAEVPEDTIKQLVGHERGITGGVYFNVGHNPTVLKPYIDKVVYPALEDFYRRHPEFA